MSRIGTPLRNPGILRILLFRIGWEEHSPVSLGANVTNNRHTDEAGSSGGATRAGALGRLLWTRALPGSVAVVAALTIPEFSVGAGDLTGPRGLDKPLDPPSKAGQGQGKRVPDAAKQPLAGVRYGALFEVSAANTLSADPSRIADLAPAAVSSDGATLAVSPSVEWVANTSGA